MPRHGRVAGSEVGRFGKQERKRSDRSFRTDLRNPFPSNNRSPDPASIDPKKGENRGVRRPLLDLLVLFHFAVADVDDAVRVQRDVVLVRHQHDCIALLVEALEQPHDLVAGGRVQVAGRLVG